MTEYLLAIENLKTYFYTREGEVPAVDGVNLTIKPGGTLALVGESGCGKSVTALSIMRLIPRPPGKIVEGRIMFNGENLLEKTESEMRAIRGNEISMIFQDPMTALNPVFTVGRQISEALILHQGLSKGEARMKAIEMLKLVGIPSPERRVDDYPHQMSGGMRQRVMIAMALSCSPKLLIADEPTTALDVTIQAHILDRMPALQQELQTALLLITHDVGVVAESGEEVAVMYLGRIVEQAAVNELFADPRHPYTIGLLGSIPKLHEDRDRLQVIEGLVPDPLHMPRGCRFHPRCPFVEAVCREEEPPTTRLPGDHLGQCWREV